MELFRGEKNFHTRWKEGKIHDDILTPVGVNNLEAPDSAFLVCAQYLHGSLRENWGQRFRETREGDDLHQFPCWEVTSQNVEPSLSASEAYKWHSLEVPQTCWGQKSFS